VSAAAARPSFPAEADVSRLKTIEVVGSFDDFLRGLPSILEADSFRSVARGIASAIRSQRGVVWLLGGHTIKTGLSPVLIRMMERGGPTYLAGNGSVAIHDYEVPRWGATS
jgi:hypothetical protein